MTEEKVHKKYKCRSLFSYVRRCYSFFSARCICLVLFISKNFYFLRPFYVLEKNTGTQKLLSLLLNVGRKMKLSKKARVHLFVVRRNFFDESTNSDLKAQNHILNE